MSLSGVLLGVVIGGAVAMMVGFVMVLFVAMEIVSLVTGVENPMRIRKKK